MGMFDTLRVEIKIPGYSGIPTDEFQTKDLGCNLENYVITNNGELYREEWDYEIIDDDRHMFTIVMKKIDGSYRREYLTNYHGDINFYNGTVNGRWRDYYARFTEGKLTRIWYEDKQY